MPEYWIVNPQSETITVLWLSGTAYEEAGVYRRGESAAALLLPHFSIDVASVVDAECPRRSRKREGASYLPPLLRGTGDRPRLTTPANCA